MCINLSIDDYREDFAKMLESILSHINYSSPTDEEIWDTARNSEEIPHIGNIYLEALLNSIQAYCAEHDIDCQYYVNSLDSHLYIRGEEVHDLEGFIRYTRPENNPNLSYNESIIAASGLEVIEDSDQEGMYCWHDSDISYANRMMAEEALANTIISVVRENNGLSRYKDWSELEVEKRLDLVRSYYDNL